MIAKIAISPDVTDFLSLISLLSQVASQRVQLPAVLPLCCRHSLPLLQLSGIYCCPEIIPVISQYVSQALPYYLDLSEEDTLYTDVFFPFFESACHFCYSTSIFIVITLTVERCQAGWSTLIGRGPPRHYSDWLDHDVANASALMP